MNECCITERSLPGRHEVLPDPAVFAGRPPELRRITALYQIGGIGREAATSNDMRRLAETSSRPCQLPFGRVRRLDENRIIAIPPRNRGRSHSTTLVFLLV